MVEMCVSSDGNVNRSIQVIHRNTIVSTCEMHTLVVRQKEYTGSCQASWLVEINVIYFETVWCIVNSL